MKEDLRRLCELTLRKLDDQLTADELRELDRLLLDNDAAQQLYLDISAVCSALAQHAQTPEVATNEPRKMSVECSQETSPEKIQEIKQYADRQLQAYLAEQENLRQAQAPHPRRLQLKLDPKRAARTIDAAIGMAMRLVVRTSVLAAAILMIIVAVNYTLSQRVVATLEKTVDAQWDQTLDSNDLKPGWYLLQQGFAQVELKQGARVLLQAPCQFRLRSPNRMTCLFGSVAADVPERARGFTVETPTSAIIDYGTAFGVSVGAHQQSDVYVFSGEIGVRSTTHRRRTPLRLRQGQNALVDGVQGVQVGMAKRGADQFVRELPVPDPIQSTPLPLNLADIVGGGNGFGSGRWGGDDQSAIGTINPLTGFPNDPTRPNGRHRNSIRYDNVNIKCPAHFIPVPSLTDVDGVFIPDSGQAPCQISSQGHTFVDCPDTSARMKWNIINGWRYRYRTDRISNTLDLAQRTGISMHANVGISFDLDAIRQAHPDTSISVFRTRVGIPLSGKPAISLADVWILVDGDLRFSQTGIKAFQEFDVHVPLASHARFLTLIVTDGQGQIPREGYYRTNNDWVFFGEPFLHLEPKQQM